MGAGKISWFKKIIRGTQRAHLWAEELFKMPENFSEQQGSFQRSTEVFWKPESSSNDQKASLESTCMENFTLHNPKQSLILSWRILSGFLCRIVSWICSAIPSKFCSEHLWGLIKILNKICFDFWDELALNSENKLFRTLHIPDLDSRAHLDYLAIWSYLDYFFGADKS